MYFADHWRKSRGPLVARGADIKNHCPRAMTKLMAQPKLMDDPLTESSKVILKGHQIKTGIHRELVSHSFCDANNKGGSILRARYDGTSKYS